MGTIWLPIPVSPEGGQSPMATEPHGPGWEVRQQLAADGAQMQRDNAALYANDARYAYQRRVDSVSQAEAMAHQTANTSRIAQESIQGKAAVMTPPVIVTGAQPA